jgi:DnaJ-domain-containing protein 1
MSITRRLVDLAKANLNALLDKAGAGGGDGLDGLSDEELEAELARRRERKRRGEAEERARYSAEEAARARAQERANEAAKARGTTAPRTDTRTPPRTEPKPPPRYKERAPSPSPFMSDKRLREIYAQLEVPFGAPFEEVKKSFRRLMRKYHPDLHIGNPAKHKTATALTMSLTQAYNELEQHLARGRRA